MCACGARSWLAAFVLAALAGSAPGARAQSAEAAGPTDFAAITYEAPEPCPQRAEFIARIQARTQNLPPAAGPATRLRVRIRVLEGEVVGSITVEETDGAVSGRRIRAASCEEAADALALIAALALDPERRGESLGAQDVATPKGPGARPARDRERTAQPDRDRTAQASDTPDSDGDARAVDEQDAAPSEHDAASSPSGAHDDAEQEAFAHRFVLTASGMFASAVVPDTVPGLVVLASYAVEPRDMPEFAARAGFAITPAVTEKHAEGEARFAWWSALFALCSGLRDADQAASLWMCAAGELGQLSAEGRRTRDPRDEDRSWVALGPALVAQWAPLSPLVLQAGAGALFALVRDRFLLGNAQVYQAPRLGIRVDLGVGIRIW